MVYNVTYSHITRNKTYHIFFRVQDLKVTYTENLSMLWFEAFKQDSFQNFPVLQKTKISFLSIIGFELILPLLRECYYVACLQAVSK